MWFRISSVPHTSCYFMPNVAGYSILPFTPCTLVGVVEMHVWQANDICPMECPSDVTITNVDDEAQQIIVYTDQIVCIVCYCAHSTVLFLKI